MENIKKYNISFNGEFTEKNLEKEFFLYDMNRYIKVIGPIVLIFGIIYMLFIISDFLDIQKHNAFLEIFIIRLIFLIVSFIFCFSIKKAKNQIHIVYWITGYEMFAIMGFLLILLFYETLTYLVFFSVMSMILAIYIIPNKLFYSQILSICLSLCFFVFIIRNIEGMEISIGLNMVAYTCIVLIYCNIGAYLTNSYKRKQYVDSKELFRISITDPLTGIYNRGKFNKELYELINNCKRSGTPLSLAMFDIDNFKRVNDTYGHLMGDCILKGITSTVQKGIREIDIFARWGGEEFVILLPNTNIEQAYEIVEKTRVCIQQNVYSNIENITCSFGVVELRDDDDEDSLIKRVDKLLYDAKASGKNIVVSDVNFNNRNNNRVYFL
ncbi:diguanylate cyclase (GGDEF)-like protein [Natranaerovirga pectinivora]|uniref:Diguanylate cyclase (GGDEF)-like protein n=1 Tax=Natranaerovirga pectinivora TaxID=682400 RepID=A0A4R3MS43_9FIRM|nr:GGDEF domain-containing protein [Natranaerovirga pectinivora]TCT17038.1 diguanylate cyclase (GGDEF)-like protein [Natranaerovirga pectinivora]